MCINHWPLKSRKAINLSFELCRFRFAFVFLKNEPAVHKIDLETFHRVKTISLKNYSCIPVSMAYTHLSGFYFVQCQSKSHLQAPPQLLIDSVTDAVIGPNLNVTGQAFVSPDGRYIVTPNPHSLKLTVQTVSFQGELGLNQETDEPVAVSDLVFQPSFTESNQHVVVATSGSGTDLLFADLSSGHTEVLRSLKEPLAPQAWPWGGPNRVVVSSGLFGQYLVTPSAESLFVLNGKQRTPHCEVSDIKRGNTVVWVGEVWVKKKRKEKAGDVGLGKDVNEKKERSGHITYSKDLCDHKLWTQPWDWARGIHAWVYCNKSTLKNRVIEKTLRHPVVIFLLGESVNAVQCNSDLCALNYTELYIIALPSMLSQQIGTWRGVINELWTMHNAHFF